MNMTEVKTSELEGEALDWAVAKVEGWEQSDTPLAQVWMRRSQKDARNHTDRPLYSLRYSTDWSQGGPLIEKYGVLLSPPKSMVHRNFGNFDARNGWYESGVWGATIFGAERKHRRRAFNHTDQPLVAAMRAIVQFELGDTVQVPADLIGGAA